MSEKKFNVILRLRRDNYFNYDTKPDFVPKSGEICLVDTARNGLRAKVGDGTTRYADLPFDFGNLIWHGHFNAEGQFIYNEEGLSAEPSVNAVYIDDFTWKAYCYDGKNKKFVQLNKLANASSTEAGLVKLYDTTGQNADGTMTQKAITDELNKKVSDWQVIEEETLSLTWE